MLYPFPSVTNPSELPQDGVFHPTPSYCARADRRRCACFYESIKDKPGPHTCPYGYGALVADDGGKPVILTGMKLAGHFVRKRVVRRRQVAFIPKVTVEAVVRALKTSRQPSASATGDRQSAARAHDGEARLKAILDSTLHEIRKLNTEIKAQTEEALEQLRNPTPDFRFVEYRTENVFATSTLVSARLDMYDFVMNPAGALAEAKRRIAIFAKFEKARHCLHARARSRHIVLNMVGNSYSVIRGYQFLELLPFLILENAVKFSPDNQAVTITFADEYNTLRVQVRSLGPHLDDDECEHVFDLSYRGRRAQRTHKGTGTGLHLAKEICQYHNIGIAVRSDSSSQTINETDYSDFIVDLEFRDVIP